MEKKKYIKPSIKAISTAPMRFICTSPGQGMTVQKLNSNLGERGLQYGGKGSGPARSRDLGWDDEDW